MDKNIIQRIAMKAVIIKDGKVLLLREAKTYVEGTNHGRYHMPGGRIEVGENFEDGLKREVREETGLEIELLMPIYVGEWRPVIKGVPHQIVATFIACQPLSNEISLSSEHDDYQWVTPGKEMAFDIMDPEDKVLEKFAEIASKGVFSQS